MAVNARIEGVSEGILRGWALDDANTRLRLDLLVLVDGAPIAQVKADRPRGDLQRHFSTDGVHGFECVLPLGVQDGTRHVVAVRAGSDGPDLATLTLLIPRRTHMLQGKVERVAEGRLHGWVWDRGQPGTAVAVELLCDGAVLASTVADHLRQDLVRAGIGSGRHGLLIPLTTLPLDRLQGMEATVRARVGDEQWVIGRITLPAPSPATGSPAAGTGREPQPDALSLLARAREAERQRDFTRAAALLDEGLHHAPRHFDLCFLRARVAMALDDVATARKFATAASLLRPSSTRPKVILARIATAQGQHQEAVDLWEQVGPGDDHHRERLLKRGRSLLVLGRAPEALREFLSATRLHPDDLNALRGAAQAAEGVGSLRAAHRQWQRYLAAAPDDQVARQLVADMARRLAPAEAVPSPLQDPWLHHWPQGAEGEAAGEDWVRPTAGMRVRSRSGRLRFAAAAPHVHRPGEPARYGIWLHAGSAEAELDFALTASARPALEAGLRMGIELLPDGRSRPRPRLFRLRLAGMAGETRLLLEETLAERQRLFDFALKLSTAEAENLAHGHLSLHLMIEPGPPVIVRPPRPLGALAAERQPQAALAEESEARTQLARLGLLGPMRREAA